MFKFLLLGAALKKSGHKINEDALEPLLFVFFIFPLAALIIITFIVCPIAGIIGGIKLLVDSSEFSIALIYDAAIGGILSYLAGVTLIGNTIENHFFPAPYSFSKEVTAKFKEEEKKNKKGCFWITIGTLVFTCILVGITTLAIVNISTHPILSGILFIILFSLSMLLAIVGAIVKLRFG
jgi:hypothetical protein